MILYGVYLPNASYKVSLHQMVAFGRDPSPGKVLRAAKFLAGSFSFFNNLNVHLFSY
jgi:hypothetical protein